MPKYRVYLQTVASLTVEVEAEDQDAALDAAYQEAPGGVCAQCSGWGQPWSLDFGGEWDIGTDATLDEAVEEVEG
jgi:hypothetical protein